MRSHFSDYGHVTTDRCERALLTLLGDVGPWRERIYLAGGLAPRYLTGNLPEGAPVHVGTTDVDVIIGLAVADEAPETYRTLQNNLEKASFRLQEPSFRWAREVDGVSVLIEFLCETDQVQPGRIFRPRGEYTGSKMGAFNVRAAQLARHDYVEREIRGERLDNGGQSAVTLRVANVLPYTVLKIFSFQDRHANKDAYDLIFTLLNQDAGPRVAGAAAATSPVAGHPQVSEALILLAERFADIAQDGPAAYAAFLASPDDQDENNRLRREAVATSRAFLDGLREGNAVPGTAL
jgi:hypothetical protein